MVVLLCAIVVVLFLWSYRMLKVTYPIKKEAWSICNAIKGELSMDMPEIHEISKTTVQVSSVAVFHQVSLATKADEMTKDSILGLVQQYVLKSEKSKG